MIVSTLPVLSEILNKFVIDSAMFALSILAEIPSGPFDFETSILRCQYAQCNMSSIDTHTCHNMYFKQITRT